MEMIRSIPRPHESVPQHRAQELTAEHLRAALNYDSDTGIFTWKVNASGSARAGDVAGKLDSSGYSQIGLFRRIHLAHRLAWFYVYGVWPKEQIDHINRIKTDNRISNLRVVSQVENLQNKGKYSNNASGHSGVSWHKPTSKWLAELRRDGKRMYLGVFPLLEDAIAARKDAELKYRAD